MIAESVDTTYRILDSLFGESPNCFVVQLWDGSYWPEERPAEATLVLNHPGTLRAMFLPGNEITLAEAYLYDDFDVQGDLEMLYDECIDLANKISSRTFQLKLAYHLLKLPSGEQRRPATRGPATLSGNEHSIKRDRQAIAYHYDVSNDFYQLFLDKRMVYSCAYFATPDQDLDAAQERKLDSICRKLRLQPGQRLLDVGCGWGGLIIHAAQKYGVDATGITLSEQQAALANARIAEAGLSDRARVMLQDYREVEASEPYDTLVSVGMFEHVGRAMLETYFEKAYELLRPQGVFLNHAIAQGATNPVDKGETFSNTYVFPDGELVAINTSLDAAEACGWEVRDVESLREHYTLTLRHWVRRLEAHHDEALRYVQEPTYRVWRLYMSGSAQGFATGRHNLYQTLLVKPDDRGRSGLPLSRADWYRNGETD